MKLSYSDLLTMFVQQIIYYVFYPSLSPHSAWRPAVVVENSQNLPEEVVNTLAATYSHSTKMATH